MTTRLAHPNRPKATPALASPWWKGAAIYQVYPISFRDSNGDGVGDLRGIIEGLPHIASLNVDALWISPFFTSPMHDYGYDVADYCDVDPRFGTLSDFDELVQAAHELKLRVIIDQIYSHTSSDHPWFEESSRSRNNAKADWYVWADPKPDGSPPSNWQSVFGGPAWQWSGARKQYYLHNFLTSQPDLNVHNRQVQDALLEVAKFWLDRGVDGFRLDAINFAMHDPQLRDNPPSSTPLAAVTRSFDMQQHLYNQSHPDIVSFLERLRSLTNRYEGCFTVAEVGGPTPLPEMRAFTAGDTRLNSAYSFDFLYAPDIGTDRVSTAMAQWIGSHGEGWPSWAFSNHDAPRAISRWARDAETPERAKLYLLLLLALRGNAFLYQGEELGLPQARVAFDDLKDPEAIENWPHTLGRDGARTPMPWRSDAPHGGFTTGEPWLPLDPRHLPLSAADQQAADNSVLHFVREILALRRASRVLREGDIELIDAPDGILAFERSLEGDRAMCAFNLHDDSIAWRPSGAKHLSVIASNQRDWPNGSPLPAELPPSSGYWATL